MEVREKNTSTSSKPPTNRSWNCTCEAPSCVPMGQCNKKRGPCPVTTVTIQRVVGSSRLKNMRKSNWIISLARRIGVKKVNMKMCFNNVPWSLHIFHISTFTSFTAKNDHLHISTLVFPFPPATPRSSLAHVRYVSHSRLASDFEWDLTCHPNEINVWTFWRFFQR